MEIRQTKTIMFCWPRSGTLIQTDRTPGSVKLFILIKTICFDSAIGPAFYYDAFYYDSNIISIKTVLWTCERYFNSIRLSLWGHPAFYYESKSILIKNSIVDLGELF